ncbi:MAG TPA: DUF1064 domain-containing protein [Ignavibacteriaceae bacterium]|nr:DUF1064 domain-containing protein [Ignavibacteriaceae bacterium]
MRFPGWTESAINKLNIKTDLEKVSKYGSRKKEYNGTVYASAFEARYAVDLDWRKKAGEIKDWRGQVTFNLIVNNILICKYIIDFVIIYNDGSKEYIETKGFETRDWKIKRKLFQALYPEKKYKVVKKCE